MPWYDEPDEPDSPRVASSHTSTRVSTLDQEEHVLDEQAPHSALPPDWQIEPRNAGVTIRVQPPATTAGGILRHCKDGFLIMDVSCWPFWFTKNDMHDSSIVAFSWN